MLKSLDILIGLTIVLLALSMAVTMITQSITTMLNSRGRHLRRGLVDMLQQLDPSLTETLSRTVATSILTHPLVSGSNTPVADGRGTESLTSMMARVRRSIGGPRLGNVVHREEFTKLLMAFATDQNTGNLETTAKNALKSALTANGVDDPEQALKNVRQLALQLEKSSPELSHMARQNLAILHAAESDFVAKINNWFDQTMDRTSQRFTASTRAITFVGAFIVAFGLQVNTPGLVNRLGADDALRAQFVNQAKAAYAAERARADQVKAEAAKAEQAKKAEAGKSPAAETQSGAATPTPGETPASQPASAATDQIAREYGDFLVANGIITLPSAGLGKWWAGFTRDNFFGILLTALLLTLGAPFWYNMLGRLLQLRSVLAFKDDVQRTERQFSERKPESVPGRPTTAAALAGERGDLSAIG